MLKFTIKIDDEAESLTAENGLPAQQFLDLVGDLLKAISPEDAGKITVGAIRDNCYAIDFFTEDERYNTNMVVVHKMIEQHGEIDLGSRERKYAGTLKAILRDRFFLQAIDKDGREVVKITSLDLKKEISHYFATRVVLGVVTEHGNKPSEFNPHVHITTEPYRIYVTEDQDLALNPHYKRTLLALRIRQKISLKDGHVISAQLLSFEPRTEGKLFENLQKIDVSSLPIMKDINSSDDILNRRYGY